MDLKYVFIGIALGAAIGYMRIKSSPTQATPRARGF